MATEKKSITLEEETVKKIEGLASKEGRSFSNMIERILGKYLGKSQN